MEVRIHDTFTGETYLASDPEDCKDDTDLYAWELVEELNETIKVGNVIAEPSNVWR
jgi:hypothetical protein